MGQSDNDSLGSGTPTPPLLLVDAEGNEVDHTKEQGKSYKYRDFSHVNEDDEEALGDGPTPAPSRNNMETSIRVQKFPVKLYAILAQKEFHDIITWMPHGRSWKVLKPNIFESMVMPLFFEYSNYHSFNRLVNAWSFRRVSSGPDRGSYYHELFLRGKPHLQKYMRRLPKTHKKLPMQKQDEPDFYRLDKTNPLPALADAPIPGGLMASNAIHGTINGDKPNIVSPSDSPSSRNGGGGGLVMGPSGRLAMPQPQRAGMFGGMGGGADAGAGGALQDDFGDLYPPQDQTLSMPPQHAGMPREVSPPYGAGQDMTQQMSRGAVLPSTSGAFRSTMAGTAGLSTSRFRTGMSTMLDPGMGGPDSDIIPYSPQAQQQQQQQQHMNNLRNIQMAHMNGGSPMNHHRMNHPMPAKMGQMNPLAGAAPRHGMPSAAEMQAMSPMRNAAGLSSMAGAAAAGAYGADAISPQQRQQMYQREAAMYGAATGGDGMGLMGGAGAAVGFDDFGAPAPGGMPMTSLSRSYPSGGQ